MLAVRARVSAARRIAIEAELELGPGITALCGSSGVGKSTLLACITGLFRPDAGVITLYDQRLFDAERGIDLPPNRRQVAIVFQSLALFPHMTAVENVAYGIARDVPRAQRRARAMAWLERMRAPHVAERKPLTYSGGEAQRVALARALASEPRALLLDEPFSALDGGLRAELGSELKALVHELALPTLLVTHDQSDVARVADTVLTMTAGKALVTERLR